MKKPICSFVFFSTVLVSNMAAAKAIPTGADNDPMHIAGDAEYHFESLPLQAELSQEKTPWSSSFWPHVYGGIAFRWNGHYQGEPSFAPLHYQVDSINEEIEELEKSLYSQERTVEENLNIIAEIARLERSKNAVNSQKAQEYQKSFFDLRRSTRNRDLFGLSQEELDRLSPSEKFDAYMYLKTGKENGFKLTKDVLNLTSAFDAYWEGICHGWTSASLEYSEPRPVTYTREGLTVNFASSDIKALLSYYDAAVTRNWVANRKTSTGRVGERCETAFPKHAWFIKDGVEYYKSVVNGQVVVNKVPANCVDTNPGSFHVVLANMIGLRDTGFAAEVVRDKEVWNQPVFKYATEILERKSVLRPWASEGAVEQVEIKTVMYYANDGGRMFWRHDGSDDEFYAWWDQTTGTSNYRFDKKEFRYYLDLDAQGNILGGQWLSYERPDFLWLKKTKGFVGTGMFHGIVNYLDSLKDLVEVR